MSIDKMSVPPALLQFEAIGDAVKRITELSERLRAERQTVDRARTEVDAAKAADRAALAQALVDGKPDPGAKATAKAEARRDQAQRMTEALTEALENAGRQLARTIQEETPRLLTEAQARMDTAREAYVARIDELAAAHRELQEAAATVGWLKESGMGRYRPTAYLAHAPIPITDAGPTAILAILDGLRAGVAPPAPKPKPQHRPFGRPGAPMPQEEAA